MPAAAHINFAEQSIMCYTLGKVFRAGGIPNLKYGGGCDVVPSHSCAEAERSAIGGVEIHSEREREGVSHTNPDIDWSRTEQNYQLHEPALHARGTYARRIDDRLREAGITRVRKDAVKLCGVVISSDQEFFSQLSAEQQREFFQRSYDFMAARYGKENILSAVVHMDETTPHMHLYLVPITPDNRLCCKEIFDKRGLAALHDEFYAM